VDRSDYGLDRQQRHRFFVRMFASFSWSRASGIGSSGNRLPRLTPGSLVMFVLGAVLLRLASVAGWAFFPGAGLGVRLGRIVIPGVMALGLVWLNHFVLRRDGWPADPLELRVTARRAGWFVAAVLAAFGIVALLLAALWVQVPFRFQRGPLTGPNLGWQTAEYFFGNSGEELIFRGYLLLALIRAWGIGRAVLATSVLFALFHLPGLGGATALKMMATTFLGGCLYAYGFLLTHTLWTAVGLHVAGNIVLHQISGASGQKSVWKPVFESPWPTAYDPAFVAWLAVLIPLVVAFAFAQRRRTAAAKPAIKVEN
jgi:membrane protease YdiL (CAAX protease family)